MKKVVYLILMMVLVALVLLTSQGYPETSKTLLGKWIKAQGGQDKLGKVKDSVVTGNFELIPVQMSGAIKIYRIEPAKQRTDIELMGMTITQAFDGQTAWMINPQMGGVQEMPENFAKLMKRQAVGNDALLNPQKYGISYNFKGKKMVKDSTCLVLERVGKDGHTTTYYLDAKTYLPVKTKSTTLDQTGAEVAAESFLADYRKVDGIMVAHKISSTRGGTDYMKLIISEIKYNTGLQASFFEMKK